MEQAPKNTKDNKTHHSLMSLTLAVMLSSSATLVTHQDACADRPTTENGGEANGKSEAPAKRVPVPEEIREIVAKQYPSHYEISQWVLNPWVKADFNGNGIQEIAVLLRDKHERGNDDNAYPTHIAIIEPSGKATTINDIKSSVLIKFKEGKPAGNQDSFRLVKNAEYLKVLGCPQPIALEIYEEASTSFYLCWDGKKYAFFRDPADEP